MAGKVIRGSHYIHRSAVELLTDVQRATVRRALAIIALPDWNIVRVDEGSVAFLEYEDFDRDPFPALRRSQRIDFASGQSISRDYRWSANPLILHRKELTLDPADPRVSKWGELTSALVAKDMFRDAHLIGRRQQWAARLEAAKLKVVEDRLCQV